MAFESRYRKYPLTEDEIKEIASLSISAHAIKGNYVDPLMIDEKRLPPMNGHQYDKYLKKQWIKEKERKMTYNWKDTNDAREDVGYSKPRPSRPSLQDCTGKDPITAIPDKEKEYLTWKNHNRAMLRMLIWQSGIPKESITDEIIDKAARLMAQAGVIRKGDIHQS